MSGHSKWHSIKHKKGANDKKRGKIFTKHARLITISAKNGADPSTNPALRAAIDSAKADNVPNENIDRAIKKGSGEGGQEIQMFEIMYEGYGPSGVAILISVVTDNKNRSVSNVRTIMQKNGGNLGEAGSVSWMFEKKAYFVVDIENKNPEEAELEIIEMGVDDIKADQNIFEVFAAPDMLFEVKTKLEAAKYKIEDSKLAMIPKNTVQISEVETAQKIVNLIDKIDEDDDVFEIYANYDFDQAVLDKLE
jgi:YebC/PmpR family DNA-binding regulatory protein